MVSITLAKQLYRARVAARKRGLPGNLFVPDWVRTVADFEDKCAYCRGTWWTIDHFIPLALGGGTTASNCVPCCSMCNQLKGSLHPDHVTSISHEKIEHVRNYLAQRKAQRSLQMRRILYAGTFPSLHISEPMGTSLFDAKEETMPKRGANWLLGT